jgi:hypothetical protein
MCLIAVRNTRSPIEMGLGLAEFGAQTAGFLAQMTASRAGRSLMVSY